MSTVIGIDLGISSTKIVGIENGKRIKSPMVIKGSDSVSSMYGAFGPRKELYLSFTSRYSRK